MEDTTCKAHMLFFTTNNNLLRDIKIYNHLFTIRQYFSMLDYLCKTIWHQFLL